MGSQLSAVNRINYMMTPFFLVLLSVKGPWRFTFLDVFYLDIIMIIVNIVIIIIIKYFSNV